MNHFSEAQSNQVSRRGFIGGAAVAGMGALATSVLEVSAETDSTDSGATPDFSFVHLTDMHVTPKRWGDKGYRKCLESLRDLKPKPAFLMMGGDLAFDGLYTPKSDFEEQIRLYKEITNGIGISHYNCMGNHDVLGWSGRRKVSSTDSELGKRMIMDRLEWEKSYYSFDFGGWHFVVLDSIYPIASEHGPSYEPRIGDEQLEWLAYDLGAAAGRPTVAVTHIAAFCNMGQLHGDRNRKAMDGQKVLWDTHRLRAVLERHGVKALLQGHSHVIEEYRFNDVWYLTSAAVSGAWWSGGWGGKMPGYTVFYCRGDELSWQHVPFHWDAHLEPDDELERKKLEEDTAIKKKQLRLLEMEQSGKRSNPAKVGP